MRAPQPSAYVPLASDPGNRPNLWFVSAIVVLASLRSAWSTLDRWFIGDDFAYVGRFVHFPWRDWPSLFTHDWSGGMWGYTLPELRPFAALSFMLDAQLWGANPLGYHLTNFALDAGCAVLVLLIAWRVLGASGWLAGFAGVLFACHPAHAEPVAWITGRVDLAGTFCYLLGFLAAARFLQGGRRGWELPVAWGAYLTGIFTKEFCLTMPLLVLAWGLICGRNSLQARVREIATLTGGFLLGLGIYAVCRHVAFSGSASTPPPLDLLGPAHLERQLSYVRWMLFPWFDFIPGFAGVPRLVLWLSAFLVLAGMIAWRWRRPTSAGWRVTLCFGFIWYAVATVPLVVATYFSPRHLYLATAGASIATIFLLAEFVSRRWMLAALLAFSVFVSARHFDQAVRPWRHAAKSSEAFQQEIARARSQLKAGEYLLLDIPEYHDGAWVWSWATPFALQPPFSAPLANPVIERPIVYFAEGRWSTDRDLAGLVNAPGAILISLDDPDHGQVSQLVVGPEKLHRAARFLSPGAVVDARLAWRQFVEDLRAP